MNKGPKWFDAFATGLVWGLLLIGWVSLVFALARHNWSR